MSRHSEVRCCSATVCCIAVAYPRSFFNTDSSYTLRVYEEWLLEDIFLQGVPMSIHLCMRSYRGSEKNGKVEGFALHETSSGNMQHASYNIDVACNNGIT